jgi:hypothetical protein
MGKASSNKKVARAAGTGGGRTGGARRPWNFYGAIALVVILGLVFTVTSRNRRIGQINNAGGVPPTVGTVWNEGFAVDVCGKFLPAINSKKDPYGITTKGDGVIHIDPTVKSAAGANATLGKFASSIGMKLNAGELQVPGGHLYQDADNCSGKASHVFVSQFNSTGDTVGQVQTIDPANVPLVDQDILVVAFLPGTNKKPPTIPMAPTYVITNLKKLAAPATTTTSAAPAVSTGSATTTPTGSSATTTAGSGTTTATTKPTGTTTPTTAAKTTSSSP